MTQVPLPLFLVGLPGSGKSRVGRALSDSLGVPHIDSDQLIEQDQGWSIAEIFESRGEDYFREIEAATISALAGEPAVVSLGGGAIESEAVQELLKAGTTVWIRGDEEELLQRIRRSNRRPMMKQNPRATLRSLSERRSPMYEKVATIEVWTSAGPPQQVSEQIMAGLSVGNDTEATEVRVSGSHDYPVIIGAGVARRISDLIPGDAQNVFFVYPETIGSLAEPVMQQIRDSGRNVIAFAHPDAELAKTYAVAQRGWDALGESHVGRRDVVVSFGGGATTDMGGFLAATWLRGIGNINVTTTVLGMVDAAVGGKTGINTDAGKNLVGAFSDPIAVLCDTDFIATLPTQDYRAGLGEVIKAGFIADPAILELFRSHPEISDPKWAATDGAQALREAIERAVRVKADVVGEDRLESGKREFLNYGHTLAHAIEKDRDYTVRHGEAVSIGAVFAAELAKDLGLLSDEEVEAHRELFGGAGLPTEYRGSLDELLQHMLSDKKVRGGKLRFVLLDGVGNPVVRQIDAAQLTAPAERIGLDV